MPASPVQPSPPSTTTDEVTRAPAPAAATTTTAWVCFAAIGTASLLAWNSWVVAAAALRRPLRGSPFYPGFPSWLASVFFSSNLAVLVAVLVLPAAVPSLSSASAAAASHFTPRARLVTGLTLGVAVFGSAGVLVTVGSSGLGATAFFVATMSLVLLSSLASSLTFGAVALAAEYSPICAQAFSTGQGFAGLIPATTTFVLLVLEKGRERRGNFGEDDDGSIEAVTAGRTFFTSMIVALLALVAVAFLPKTTKSNGYVPLPDEPSADSEASDVVEDAPVEEEAVTAPRPDIGSMTLAVYPALTSAVTSVHSSGAGWRVIFEKDVFVALGLVIFNVADIIGKATPGDSRLHVRSGESLATAAMHSDAVLGESLPRIGDAGFFTLMAALAGTGGWLGSSGMMQAAAAAAAGAGPAAADVVVASLALGLVSGSWLSFFVAT
ncbi:hypothetical protein HK405_015567 [Cladochytrium tenue]|nr:hypothetical protein HK405_015567 [Cladochytrium tenue]